MVEFVCAFLYSMRYGVSEVKYSAHTPFALVTVDNVGLEAYRVKNYALHNIGVCVAVVRYITLDEVEELAIANDGHFDNLAHACTQLSLW